MCHNLMRAPPVNICQESHAAGVMFKGGIVQTRRFRTLLKMSLNSIA